jgi:hypothetical protein
MARQVPCEKCGRNVDPVVEVRCWWCGVALVGAREVRGIEAPELPAGGLRALGKKLAEDALAAGRNELHLEWPEPQAGVPRAEDVKLMGQLEELARTTYPQIRANGFKSVPLEDASSLIAGVVSLFACVEKDLDRLAWVLKRRADLESWSPDAALHIGATVGQALRRVENAGGDIQELRDLLALLKP